MKTPFMELLVPIGKVLLLGSFGASLLQAIRGRFPLNVSFERLVLGMIALAYFDRAALTLQWLSDELIAAISQAGHSEDLRGLLLDAFKKAASAPAPAGSGARIFNAPAILEQAWRTGVWGVMSALVEGVYLIASFVLECARDVLWQLLLFVLPIAAGLMPVLPGMLAALTVYALELVFWLPMLCLVESVTGTVARSRLTEDGSLGLTLIGVECVAIVLILSIPALTHRIMQGALNGDLGAQQSVLGWARGIVFEGRTSVIKSGGQTS